MSRSINFFFSTFVSWTSMAFSCIDSSAADEFVDFTLAEHYSKMYSKCLIELAERALKRMKDDKGTILFISSPGCNMTQTPKPGYDMPGKLEKKCIVFVFVQYQINQHLL